MSHFEGMKSVSVPVSDNNWHSVYYSRQPHWHDVTDVFTYTIWKVGQKVNNMDKHRIRSIS